MVAIDSNLLIYAHRQESPWHAEALRTIEELAVAGRITGGAIHDARIAAICRHNGVTELWSSDRDFSRFADFRTRNPLVEAG